MDKFNITADHPVLARIDKYGLTEKAALKLLRQIIDQGYENIKTVCQ